MLNRLTITFTEEERKALDHAARSELRTVKDQIRWLIRCSLGLTPAPHTPAPTAPTIPPKSEVKQNERQPS